MLTMLIITKDKVVVDIEFTPPNVVNPGQHG